MSEYVPRSLRKLVFDPGAFFLPVIKLYRWWRWRLLPLRETRLQPGERRRKAASGARAKTGYIAECAAVRYLVENGYEIRARNRETSIGEIDIVALKDDFVVFVEVRSRRTGGIIRPEETVRYDKKRRLARITARFMRARHMRNIHWRVDLIAIEISEENRVIDLRHHIGISLK